MPLDVLLEELPVDARDSASDVLATSYGGYTTNVRYSDIVDGKAWIAFEYDGAPLAPEHGGPARLLIPHLYLWKSAKWVTSIQLLSGRTRGFWEVNGYPTSAIPGSRSAIREVVRRTGLRHRARDADRTARRGRIVESGDTGAVFESPREEDTRALLDSRPGERLEQVVADRAD